MVEVDIGVSFKLTEKVCDYILNWCEVTHLSDAAWVNCQQWLRWSEWAVLDGFWTSLLWDVAILPSSSPELGQATKQQQQVKLTWSGVRSHQSVALKDVPSIWQRLDFSAFLYQAWEWKKDGKRRLMSQIIQKSIMWKEEINYTSLIQHGQHNSHPLPSLLTLFIWLRTHWSLASLFHRKAEE